MTDATGTNPRQTVVEVEFVVSDPRYPLVALSAETGCEAELIQILPRSETAYTVYHRITGATPEQILDLTRDDDDWDARLVAQEEESSIIEFRLCGDKKFFAISLTLSGGRFRFAVQSLDYQPFRARVVTQHRTAGSAKLLVPLSSTCTGVPVLFLPAGRQQASAESGVS